MRILLQHFRTQLYLRSLGSWTAEPLEAFDFRHSRRAIDFARTHALPGVQIVTSLDDRDQDQVLPLPAHAAARTRHSKTHPPARPA